MKVLLDTSVLVAAMLPDHPMHGHAFPWLSRAKDGHFDFFVSGHTLAEVYAVLTRLPRAPRITPAEALKLIQQDIVPRATVVTLSPKHYVELIEELAARGIAGGAVYDGLIAKAASLADVDVLLTFNVTNFQRVSVPGKPHIASPETVKAP